MVDLPHPDGPTSTQNSPSVIEMSTPWMTLVDPNAFRTPSMLTDAKQCLLFRNSSFRRMP
jgi:hypothetical protein